MEKIVWPLVSRDIYWFRQARVVWSCRWGAGSQQCVVWGRALGVQVSAEHAGARDEGCTRNGFSVTAWATAWAGDCRKVLSMPRLQVCNGTSFWIHFCHRLHWMLSHPPRQPLPLPGSQQPLPCGVPEAPSTEKAYAGLTLNI